jgi:hypothetical protein
LKKESHVAVEKWFPLSRPNQDVKAVLTA